MFTWSVRKFSDFVLYFVIYSYNFVPECAIVKDRFLSLYEHRCQIARSFAFSIDNCKVNVVFPACHISRWLNPSNKVCALNFSKNSAFRVQKPFTWFVKYMTMNPWVIHGLKSGLGDLKVTVHQFKAILVLKARNS